LRPQSFTLLSDQADGPTCQCGLNKVYILTRLAALGFSVNLFVALYKKNIKSTTVRKASSLFD
jgi:hypothetical protein